MANRPTMGSKEVMASREVMFNKEVITNSKVMDKEGIVSNNPKVMDSSSKTHTEIITSQPNKEIIADGVISSSHQAKEEITVGGEIKVNKIPKETTVVGGINLKIPIKEVETTVDGEIILTSESPRDNFTQLLQFK